jgi:hypothetical protein
MLSSSVPIYLRCEINNQRKQKGLILNKTTNKIPLIYLKLNKQMNFPLKKHPNINKIFILFAINALIVIILNL